MVARLFQDGRTRSLTLTHGIHSPSCTAIHDYRGPLPDIVRHPYLYIIQINISNHHSQPWRFVNGLVSVIHTLPHRTAYARKRMASLGRLFYCHGPSYSHLTISKIHNVPFLLNRQLLQTSNPRTTTYAGRRKESDEIAGYGVGLG